MPTPSTRTPVRIARGSYSNLNGSVSDLQDGEISYAEDQDKLYIKEGTSLVALTYTPASPAFTGTITGVNLTLSGNLTVNGTQTIINTQTLDVEDKQIEIGKVSSPSDTTADQGGIILKGASDKSMLWVDATNNWTFNQNLEIKAGEGGSAYLFLSADEADDNADQWRLQVNTTGLLHIANKSTGSWVDNLSIDGSGNVLIGTNSGSHRLTVQGSGTEIARFLGANGADLKFRNSTSNDFLIYTGTSDRLLFGTNGQNVTLTLDVNQNATFAGTVSDSKGNLRNIPQNSQTGSSNYDLVVADAGKHISRSGGNITVKNSTFQAGDAITIINNNSTGGAAITLTQESGLTMYLATDGSTGDRSLAARGMCTLIFTHTSYAYISGAGLT